MADDSRRIGIPLTMAIAAAVAVFTARPYAGSWNDGSRLATVESLVERHTFVIDESIYVVTPAPVTPGSAPPYASGDALLADHGTKDKMLVGGHFYSDKSPVPAVLMAGVYQLWRWVGGPAAAERPDWFARGLTLIFASGPFILAVWCVRRIVRRVGVPTPWDVWLVASFALGSVALPYAQHVNNHILLLAVGALAADLMLRLDATSGVRAAGLGGLAGLAYTIDLGAGPPLALALGGWIVWQSRRVLPVAMFGLAAMPWLVLHHLLNYEIAGTLGPANGNPEFFRWPGSPFDESNMTGHWAHASGGKAGLYALDLLFGKKGFLMYTPPMLLVVAVLPRLLRRPLAERPALVALGAWAAGTWLLYAATSRNLSGACLTVRWFVPLLVPGYVALAVMVREFPAYRVDLAVLAAGGFAIGGEGVIRGPWTGNVPYVYWPAAGLAMIAWGIVAARRSLARGRQTRVLP